MNHSPHKRKDPRRLNRSQVYASEYITTSFGPVKKHDIWEGIKCFVVFLAFFEGTLLVMGRLYGWI